MTENKDEMTVEPVDIEERIQLDLAEEVYNLKNAIWALVKVLRTKQ